MLNSFNQSENTNSDVEKREEQLSNTCDRKIYANQETEKNCIQDQPKDSAPLGLNEIQGQIKSLAPETYPSSSQQNDYYGNDSSSQIQGMLMNGFLQNPFQNTNFLQLQDTVRKHCNDMLSCLRKTSQVYHSEPNTAESFEKELKAFTREGNIEESMDREQFPKTFHSTSCDDCNMNEPTLNTSNITENYLNKQQLVVKVESNQIGNAMNEKGKSADVNSGCEDLSFKISQIANLAGSLAQNEKTSISSVSSSTAIEPQPLKESSLKSKNSFSHYGIGSDLVKKERHRDTFAVPYQFYSNDKNASNCEKTKLNENISPFTLVAAASSTSTTSHPFVVATNNDEETRDQCRSLKSLDDCATMQEPKEVEAFSEFSRVSNTESTKVKTENEPSCSSHNCLSDGLIHKTEEEKSSANLEALSMFKRATEQELRMLLMLTHPSMLSLSNFFNLASLSKQMENFAHPLEAASFLPSSAMMMLQQQRISERPQTPTEHYLDSTRKEKETIENQTFSKNLSAFPSETPSRPMFLSNVDEESKGSSSVTDEHQMHFACQNPLVNSAEAMQLSNEEDYCQQHSPENLTCDNREICFILFVFAQVAMSGR